MFLLYVIISQNPIESQIFMDMKNAKNQLKLQSQKKRINQLIKKVDKMMIDKQEKLKSNLKRRRIAYENDDLNKFFYS